MKSESQIQEAFEALKEEAAEILVTIEYNRKNKIETRLSYTGEYSRINSKIVILEWILRENGIK